MKRINKQTLPCTIEGCEKLQKVHGLCSMHDRRRVVHGDLSIGREPKKIGVVKCSIEGCSNLNYSRGWCSTHYSRWSTTGSPLAQVRSPGFAQRYLEDVVLKYAGNDCLTWLFGCNTAGYGIINNPEGTNLVSRIVCERIHGAPPTPSHEARHLCGKGTEACCAPAHLAWGTPHENQMDKVVHGTDIRGERHPLHKLTEEQAREALRLKGTVPQAVIAEMFGVARATISHVQNRTTWAWL